MFDGESPHEGIAWPSYVDFLSTFIFILIIFLGSLLYLLSGDLGEKAFVSEIASTSAALQGTPGLQYRIDLQGRRIYISLRDQVKFKTGCPDPARKDCPAGVPEDSRENLRQVGRIIGKNPRCRRIVIEGRADSQPYQGNPFGNRELSVRRALEVLKFFYECEDCGYDVHRFRPKFVLSGLGETMNASVASADDPVQRRVDVVIDYAQGLQ